MNGKSKCKILKDIRRRIAEENDIAYVTSECKFQGNCRGTCPKCEAEVRYLEEQLEARKRAGRAVALAGLALTMTTATASCFAIPQNGNDTTSAEVTDITNGTGEIDITVGNEAIPSFADIVSLPEEEKVAYISQFHHDAIRKAWGEYLIRERDQKDEFEIPYEDTSYSVIVTYLASGMAIDVTCLVNLEIMGDIFP